MRTATLLRKLQVLASVNALAELHVHADGAEPARLCVRQEFVPRGPERILEAGGWEFDGDTSDWFVELPEGCP